MENKFRFSSRKQYEDEMIRLIAEKKQSEKEYEELLNEYLEFCLDGNQ